MEQKNNKKVLIQISVIILIILLLCTFLSKSIYNMSLPYVEVINPAAEKLSVSSSATGEVMVDSQKICYNVPLKITEVYVKENDEVKAGDVLFEVDSKEFSINIQKKELEIQKIEDQLDEWLSYKDRAKLEDELEIAEGELELYKEQVPYEGKVCAGNNGLISTVKVNAGDLTKEGDTLAEITDEAQSMSVKFSFGQTDDVLCRVGDEVQLTYMETAWYEGKPSTEEKTVNTTVIKREYDTEKKQYFFYAEIDNSNKKFYEGQKIKVNYIISSDLYENVVPLNAISKDENRDTVVYVLQSRDGLFGEEYYVKKVKVDQLEKNNVKSAINGDDISAYIEVVVSSSRALTSGETVRVVR